MKLEQAIRFFWKALLYCRQNAVVVRHGKFDTVYLFKLYPSVCRDAIADAERELDEAAVAACSVDRLVESLIGALVILHIAHLSVLAAFFLSGDNSVDVSVHGAFCGETPAGSFQLGHDFEQLDKLSDAEFGDDCAPVRPDFNQSVGRELPQCLANGGARCPILFGKLAFVEFVAGFQPEGENVLLYCQT